MFSAGDKIVNMRNGKVGTVLEYTDDAEVVIQFDDLNKPKTVCASSIRRWYKPFGYKPSEIRQRRDTTLPPLPQGPPDCGENIRKMFYRLVKSLVPTSDDLFYQYNTNSKTYVFKLNGFNIIEVRKGRRRISVMVNPKCLSPELRALAYHTYPKTTNWSLRTRFIFTDWPGEKILMKQVIMSAIYSRSRSK